VAQTLESAILSIEDAAMRRQRLLDDTSILHVTAQEFSEPGHHASRVAEKRKLDEVVAAYAAEITLNEQSIYSN
jgi:hypothetical protein